MSLMYRLRSPSLTWMAVSLVAGINSLHISSAHALDISRTCSTLLHIYLTSTKILPPPALHQEILTWTVGSADEAHQTRERFKHMPDADKTPQQLASFLLGQGFFTKGSSEPMYQTRTQKQDAPVREIIAKTDIEKNVAHRTKKKGDTGEAKIITAIDHIQSRKLVEEGDIAALEDLRKRVMVFEGTTQFLQKKSAFEGQVDKLIAEYLKKNKAAIREKIEHLPNGQNVILNMPKVVFDKNTHAPSLSADVIIFKDVDAFDSYFDRRMTIAREASNMKRLTRQYLEDYVFGRSMARRLQSIPVDDVVFSIDSDISIKEAENKIQYQKATQAIASAFSMDKPIHPSTSTLASHSKSVRWEQLRNKAYISGITIAIGTLTLWDNYSKAKAIYSEVADPVEEKQDNDHAFDEEYWKKKCSAKATYSEVQTCLDRYRKILTAAIQGKSKAKGPSSTQSEIDEFTTEQRELFDSISVAVIYGTLQRTPFGIYTQINFKRSMSYAEDFIYKAGEKANPKKKVAGTSKSDTSTPNAGYDKMIEGLLSKPQTLSEIANTFSALSTNFHNSSVRHSLDRQSLSDNPQAATFLDLRHLMFLKEILDNMKYMQNSPTVSASEPKAKDLKTSLNKEIALLEDQINGTMDSVEATVKSVLAKVSKDDSLPANIADDASPLKN